MLLGGRIVLITGATGGIGEAMARLFAEQGANLVLTGRSETLGGIATSLAIESEHLLVLRGDIAQESYALQLVQATRKKFGRLDVLVNNAGVMLPGSIGMTSMAKVREMLEVNLIATINMTQLAVRIMGKSSGPSIINVASIAGTCGVEGLSGYCASKAGIIGFTVSAAKELASKGIRVNAIAPGFIDTPMSRGWGKELFRKQVERIRMGRVGSPRDVANGALFLASDLSSYVTGQVIGVDGGMQV